MTNSTPGWASAAAIAGANYATPSPRVQRVGDVGERAPGAHAYAGHDRRNTQEISPSIEHLFGYRGPKSVFDALVSIIKNVERLRALVHFNSKYFESDIFVYNC